MFVYARDIPFGERMLWASVIRRAIFDFILYKGLRQHSLEWKRSCQYLFTPDQTYENGYSFEEVCELFGWEPDYLRRRISKLTRADIRRMETSDVRDEFVYNEIAAVVEQTERWKTENFAAPFLPLYKYNREYREKLRPRIVRRESHLGEVVPMMQWQAAM